jgi:hypothetical protein
MGGLYQHPPGYVPPASHRPFINFAQWHVDISKAPPATRNKVFVGAIAGVLLVGYVVKMAFYKDSECSSLPALSEG